MRHEGGFAAAYGVCILKNISCANLISASTRVFQQNCSFGVPQGRFCLDILRGPWLNRPLFLKELKWSVVACAGLCVTRAILLLCINFIVIAAIAKGRVAAHRRRSFSFRPKVFRLKAK